MQKAKGRAGDSADDESPQNEFVDALMKQAREEVAAEFLEACGSSERKRRIVLDLCRTVLGHQFSETILAEDSGEESECEADHREQDGGSDIEDTYDDDIPYMAEIVDYPYQDDLSAETGELPFEEFKDLLEPEEPKSPKYESRRQKPSLLPSKDAISLFGEKNATKLVNWHFHVKQAGQLYSNTWLEGKIRDSTFGPIEKPMLLMCLQDYRIATAMSSVLGKICDDLGLGSIVKEALEFWGVADTFPKVWAKKFSIQYTANIKACRQCEIFVARTHICLKTLKATAVSDDLGLKLMSCFEYMEDNLPQKLVKETKKKREKKRSRGTNERRAYGDGQADCQISTTKQRLDKSASPQLQGNRKNATLKDSSKKKSAAAAARNEKSAKIPRGFAPGSDKIGAAKDKNRAKIRAKEVGGFQGETVSQEKEKISHAKSSITDDDVTTEPNRKRRASNLQGWKRSKMARKGDGPGTSKEKQVTSEALSNGPKTQNHHANAALSDNLSGCTNSLSLTLRAISSMPEIEDSPYLRERNAEVGEELFDCLKDVLLPKDSNGRHLEASPAATKLFGKTLAESMVTANHTIARSGMVYGSDWKDGKIYGKKCGYIPRPMLLLCLQEQRLAATSPDELGKIIFDLGVCEIMQDAARVWKLESMFPLLDDMTSLSCLHSKTKALLGCIIFVARSYRCMVTLRRRKVEESILKKVRRCLSLVHDSLEQKVEWKKNAKAKLQNKIGTKKSSKSTELVVQKEKRRNLNGDKNHVANRNRLDYDAIDPEPMNPGIIMHNLFAKPAKISAKSSRESAKTTSTSKAKSPASAPTVSNRFHANDPMKPTSKYLQAPANPPVEDLSRASVEAANPRRPQSLIPPQTTTRRLTRDQQRAPSRFAQHAVLQTHLHQTQKNIPTQSHRKGQFQDAAVCGMGFGHAANRNAPSNRRPVTAVTLPAIGEEPESGKWYPLDDSGVLSATETELAWLTTECSFALRLPSSEIRWDFVWQYASPSLKVELRDATETQLDKLVRFHDGFVRTRFEILKEFVLENLNLGHRRGLMKRVIPLLRHRSRLLAKAAG